MTSRERRPIVVGIDGSPDARRALCLAGEMALERGAELIVVHAVGLMAEIDGRRVPSEGHATEIAEQFASWCDAVRTVGLEEWTPVLRHGDPAELVSSVARDANAALVVVGRHGSGQRPELLLGSTAHQVIERARCPVLVVPPVGTSAQVAPG